MPLRFSLRQLEYLVAVGECGSIALASEKVNVSSPSISAAISQLEAEFGLPLFVRKHAHGLSPTQGGRRFIDQARRVLAEAGRLSDLANDITGQVRGPLTVGCLLTFAQIVLPYVRRTFCDRHGDVEFRQTVSHQAELFEALRGATMDIALTYEMNIPPDLDFVPLVSLPPYAVMHDTHELGHMESVSARDLTPYPMVLLDLPLSADYFLSFFTAIGVRPNIAERTRDMAVMHSLVANGFGYSIANIRPLSNLSPDGRKLRFVPLTGPVRPLRMGLAMSEGAKASLTIRAFIDHCRETITPDQTPGLQIRPLGPPRDF